MLISLWLWATPTTPYSYQTSFRGPHKTLRPVSTLKMNKQRNFTRNQINFFVSFDHHLKFRQKSFQNTVNTLISDLFYFLFLVFM